MDTFNANTTIEEKTKDILISNGYMSTRLFNCLKRSGYKSLYEVITSDPEDLCKIRNFGRQTQDEVEALISFVRASSRSEILRRCVEPVTVSVAEESDFCENKRNMISQAYGRYVSSEDFVCTERSGTPVFDCLMNPIYKSPI